MSSRPSVASLRYRAMNGTVEPSSSSRTAAATWDGLTPSSVAMRIPIEASVEGSSVVIVWGQSRVSEGAATMRDGVGYDKACRAAPSGLVGLPTPTTPRISTFAHQLVGVALV